MRAALEAASANGASFTPKSSRPGSAAAAAAAAAAAGSASGISVLEQRLEAAQRQVGTLQALNANLESQLSDAQQAQQQLAAAARQLAALLPAGSSRPPSSGGSVAPATTGGAGGVLRLQAHQLQQLASHLADEVTRCQRGLSSAQEQASTLTLQLASRNALVDALQTRLRALTGSASDSGGGSVAAAHAGVSEGTQTGGDGPLLAPPAPLAATSSLPLTGGDAAAAGDALGSLDRIVGLWRQACGTKDGQLLELQRELEQVGRKPLLFGCSRRGCRLKAKARLAPPLLHPNSLMACLGWRLLPCSIHLCLPLLVSPRPACPSLPSPGNAFRPTMPWLAPGRS